MEIVVQDSRCGPLLRTSTCAGGEAGPGRGRTLAVEQPHKPSPAPGELRGEYFLLELPHNGRDGQASYPGWPGFPQAAGEAVSSGEGALCTRCPPKVRGQQTSSWGGGSSQYRTLYRCGNRNTKQVPQSTGIICGCGGSASITLLPTAGMCTMLYSFLNNAAFATSPMLPTALWGPSTTFQMRKLRTRDFTLSSPVSHRK